MYVRPVLCSATVLLANCAASQIASTHVVHEQRPGPPQGWMRRPSYDVSGVLPMKVGLRQRNLHRADEWLMDVSDPASTKYGNHWTAKEIVETFAPRSEY